jgi:hypothetical protein
MRSMCEKYSNGKKMCGMFIRAVVWGDNEIINENEDEKLGAVNL